MMPRIPERDFAGRARDILARGCVCLVLSLGLAACDEDDFVDATRPAPPSGLDSVTGDSRVIVSWLPNREPDLAGYRLWRNTDGGLDYFLIDEFDAYDPDFYDVGEGPGTDIVIYDDTALSNGQKYWYGVTAFDRDGNESELSYEFLSDVPRPEGETVLQDAGISEQFSGFDFSRAPSDDTAQAWYLASTDVYLEYDQDGIPFFWTPLPTVAREVRVQDYGYGGFDVLTWAPLSGYSRSGIVEAIEGHTYAFEIIADPLGAATSNFAKLTVLELDGDSARLMWGYQEVTNERELAIPDSEPRHTRRELRPSEVQ